jgi:hypothetical protein
LGNKNSLVAKCGKTGFKNSQGLAGHERMCTKCQGIDNKKDESSSTKKPSTEKPKNKECQHNYRLLTKKEKEMINSSGQTIEELGYDVICTKCGELE